MFPDKSRARDLRRGWTRLVAAAAGSPRERGLADAFTTYRGGRLAELGDRAAARRGFQRLREHVLRRRALEPAPPPWPPEAEEGLSPLGDTSSVASSVRRPVYSSVSSARRPRPIGATAGERGREGRDGTDGRRHGGV